MKATEIDGYGYLNLITSQIDPVHFLKIDNNYYTLSFRKSNKVSFIQEKRFVWLDFSYDNSAPVNRRGPFKVKRKQLTTSQFEQEIIGKSKAIAEVITDDREIMKFQEISETNCFNYFPKKYMTKCVLIKYQLVVDEHLPKNE